MPLIQTELSYNIHISFANTDVVAVYDKGTQICKWQALCTAPLAPVEHFHFRPSQGN